MWRGEEEEGAEEAEEEASSRWWRLRLDCRMRSSLDAYRRGRWREGDGEGREGDG